MAIAENIAFYRAKSKMTIRQLSKKTGYSESYIKQLEYGDKRNPSIAVLMDLSKAFGCKVDDLLSEDSKKKAI